MKPIRILIIFAAAALSWGQQYVISTVAGGGGTPSPAIALTVSVYYPSAVTTDTAGNIYFTSGNSVLKTDTKGIITRVAGSSHQGFSGDGGPALNAHLSNPSGLVIDSAGNLFIADTGNSRIRRVSAGGIIATIAGSGANGFSGDGGPATQASLGLIFPVGMAIDNVGNLLFSNQSSGRVRKVSPAGIITTFAGNGQNGFSGDGGPAIGATLVPTALAFDSTGNLYVGDYVNDRIRKITPSGIITTFAGTGVVGAGGDGGPAANASLGYAFGLAFDPSGNLYVADYVNYRIRKIASNGIITTVAGSGGFGFAGDGSQATGAQMKNPFGVAVDNSGNIFIADYNNQRIRKVSGGIISTVAGDGDASFAGDGGAATDALLDSRYRIGVAVDSAGNIFIADQGNRRVRKVDPSTGIIKTFAGGGCCVPVDGFPANLSALSDAAAVAVDKSDNVYIADSAQVWKVAPNGVISNVAGNGQSGYSGDGGPATAAQLNFVDGLTVDSAGNVFIADAGNFRIRKVTPSGTISTVAGTSSSGTSPDGVAVGAKLNLSTLIVGMAADSSGNLLFTENSGSIRRLSPSGTLSTVVNGPYGPYGLVLDSADNLFFSDGGIGNRVRQVSPAGVVTTVAGQGGFGYSGDGGLATNAQFNQIYGLAIDSHGNLYLGDGANGAIRKMQPIQTGFISAILDAASESATPLTPGKIIAIYGSGSRPPATRSEPAGERRVQCATGWNSRHD